MSTTQYSPQLRPLSVGETLDASFKVFRQNFGTLALCVLVVSVPVNIVSTLITASTSNTSFEFGATRTTTSASGTIIAGTLITAVLAMVLYTLASAACFRAVSGAYLGQRHTASESWRFAATKLLPLLLLSLLFFLAVVAGTIALIVPGIWLSIALSLSFPALLSEGLSPVAAMRRSFGLVRGRWWATFGALFVMYLIVAVISGVVGAVIGGILGAATDSRTVSAVVLTIVNILASMITLPLFAAVLTILYFDLRVRKEGFDLQLLAQGVGQDAPGYATSPDAVGASSGLGSYEPPSSSPPAQSGGFAPPQAPPPGDGGGLSQGDPLGGERRPPDEGPPR